MTTSSVDNAFTYHNKFENAFFGSTTPIANMSDSRDSHNDSTLQSFTATGWSTSRTSESTKGTGAPSNLPSGFTDESIISIRVLPPPEGPDTKPAASDSDDDNPVKGLKPKHRFSFSSFRRKSSSKKDKRPEFVMKDMTRAEYLKHYAKDVNGRYIGTEDPANDCILNSKEDIMRYRKAFAFREAMSNGHAPIVFV